jgi:hypothetical protein
LLKLAFTLDNPDAALALIARQRAATAASLDLLRARLAGLPGGVRSLDHLTLRHRILLSEATLAWLDESAASLHSLHLQGR